VSTTTQAPTEVREAAAAYAVNCATQHNDYDEVEAYFKKYADQAMLELYGEIRPFVGYGDYTKERREMPEPSDEEIIEWVLKNKPEHPDKSELEECLKRIRAENAEKIKV
jgi:hypothetical protein